MALVIGDATATSGMTKSIYDQINATLAADVPADALPDVQASWKKLSFAVAAGVTNYIKRDPATEAEFAETFSSGAHDATFWPWLQQFVGVFTAWAPASADGVALKTALTTFLGTKPVPTELKGTVR